MNEVEYDVSPGGILLPRPKQPPPPLPPPDDPPGVDCHDCGRRIPHAGPWFGPTMHHRRWWTCGHQKTYTCDQCYRGNPHTACPVCGNGWEYT